MNRIKLAIISAILFFVTASSSGCVSYYVMEKSKDRVAMRKALVTNNQPAIQSIKDGNGFVGLGIDVGNLEALKERPLLQLGAAIADALLVYGSYEGIKALDDNLSGDNDSGKHNNINVQGSDNTVIIQDNSDGNQNDTDNSDGKTQY